MEFEEYLVGQGLSGKTIRLYLRHVARAQHWMQTHTHTTLQWAGPSELRAFADTLADSHSTRGQAVAALRHFWDWKERHNPPVRAIRVPPAPEMVCRAVTPDQARALVKVSLGWWPEGAAVLFGLYLALRRFEIAKAEWSRFDGGLNWYRVTGKYSKTHTLPVHPLLRSELEARAAGSRWVFPGRYDDTHIHPATVGEWVETVGHAVGIDHLEPHELRHTSLATANDNTGDLRSVQSFARHAKIGTTSGYTRTTAARLRDISASLTYIDDWLEHEEDPPEAS